MNPDNTEIAPELSQVEQDEIDKQETDLICQELAEEVAGSLPFSAEANTRHQAKWDMLASIKGELTLAGLIKDHSPKVAVEDGSEDQE